MTTPGPRSNYEDSPTISSKTTTPLVKADVVSTRSAHRQYGVSAPSAFVVRPDKYISYRGRPVELVAQHLRYQERQLQ